jgi:hypothetical protein
MQLKQTIETELEIQKNSKTLCLNKIIECLKNKGIMHLTKQDNFGIMVV